MALLFMDGFDHYASADITEKWTTGTGATIGSASSRAAVGQGVSLNSTGNITKTLTSGQTWFVGLAIKKTQFPGTQEQIIQFRNNSTVIGGLCINSDGTLEIVRNTGTAVTGGKSTATISTGVWYYIEIKYTAKTSISSGECVVNLNGVQIITVTAGQNIDNSTTGLINVLSVKNTNSTMLVDDLYVADTTGSTNNTLLGDCRIITVFPTGAGSSTGFTPSAGSNYQCVDDTTAPNDDTDYVSNTTTGRDSYAFTDLTGSPTIKGVQVNVAARKDDAGSSVLAPLVRVGSTNYLGSGAGLTTVYIYISSIWDQNPGTTANWTVSDVNSAEFGFERTS